MKQKIDRQLDRIEKEKINDIIKIGDTMGTQKSIINSSIIKECSGFLPSFFV